MQTENNAIAALAQENQTITRNLNVNRQINGEVRHTHEHIRNANAQAQNFTNTLQRGLQMMIAYRTINYVTNSIRNAYSELKNVDTEMVSIRKVTGMSADEMERLQKASYQTAQIYGRSASQYLSSVASFAKAGYEEQSQELANLAMLAMNVGEIDSDLANQFLVSSDAAWGYGGSVESLTAILDGFNELSNKSATEISELTDGVRVAGSVFANAGLSAKEYAALVGTAQAKTQESGAVTARGLRTVLMNLRQIRGTDIETGEVIDDESIAKAESALKSIDIQVRETKDGISELRNPMTILDELSSKWENLSSVQQSAIQESLSGKRQSNIFTAVMESWSDVEKAMDIYANSAGSAMKENAYYLDSWNAKLEILRANWASYIAGLQDISVIKGGLDAVSSVIKVLDTDFGKFATQLTVILTSMHLLNRGWTWIQGLQVFQRLNLSAEILRITAAQYGLGAATRMLTSALWQSARAWMATPMGIATIAITGISLINSAIEKHKQKLEEASEKAGEALDKVKSDMSDLDSLIKQYNDLQISNEWDNTSIETKKKLQEDINKLLGDEADKIDILNGKYKETTEELFKQRMSKFGEEERAAFDNEQAKGKVLWESQKGLSRINFDTEVPDDYIEKFIHENGITYDFREMTLGLNPIRDFNDLLATYDAFEEILKQMYHDGYGDSNLYDAINGWVSHHKENVEAYRVALEEFNNSKIGNQLANYINQNVGGYIDNLEEYGSVVKWINEQFTGVQKDNALGFLNSYFSEYADKIDTATGNAVALTLSLESLNKQLDTIQTAYDKVKSAIDEYNKQGYLSVDTYQSLMELEPQYLNMLLDENGNLNLNTDAVNANTKAYILNLGIKSAEKMLDALTTYSSEAEQLDYLSGALNTNTEATWANVYAKLEQLKVEGKITDAVYNSAIARIKSYEQMTNNAIAGIGKGGLGKDAGKTADNIKNINDQLKDLADSEALDKLKYKFDQIELSVQKISDTMSLLDTSLENTPENDYIGKIDITNRQMELAKEKSSLLRDEFAQLQSTEYHTADMANELAKRMKSVADSIAENSNSILEYSKNITEYYMSALNNISLISKNPLDESMNNFERNMKTLTEGSLTGLQFDLSPIVPESAYEKQRAENLSLEEEMRRYYDATAEMQKIALDMQYQEMLADNAKKREELNRSLSEASSTIAKFNTNTSDMQEEDNAEKLEETKEHTEAIKTELDNLATWIEANPLKAPDIDSGSWDKLLSDVRTKIQEIEAEISSVGSGSNGSSGDGGSETSSSDIVNSAQKYKGKKYVWGGESDAEGGYDCSGFVYATLKDAGYKISQRTTNDFIKIGAKIEKSDLKPGDLVFYGKSESNTSHMGIYIGNGKMLHSSGGENNKKGNPGKGVEEKSINYRSDYVGARRLDKSKSYAHGTSNAQNETAFVGDEYLFTGAKHPTPELIFRKETGTVELAGQNGVESVQLKKGDAVLSYPETKKVLNKNNVIGKAYATGKPTTDPEILSYIKRASEETGVPANIIMAVMDHETGYKWYDKVSDGTGYSYGYMMLYDNGAISDIKLRKGEAVAQKAKTDKYTNVYEGADLLRRHYEATGNWQEAAKRYNGSGENARKYGEKVWKEANTDAFKEAAKNLGSIATYTEETANNTSDTTSIYRSFDSQFRDFIEGSDKISNSESVEDSLMNYIKANTEISSDATEKFVEAFEGLNAYKDSMEPYFKERAKEVRNAAGTPEFASLTSAYNKDHSKYIETIMGYSTDMTVAQAKSQYKLAEDAIKKGYEYYNERKNAGASAAELMEIATKLGEIEKVAEEYSDAYVQAISAETEFLVSRTERTLNAFDNEMSWLDKDLEKAEGDTAKQTEIYGKKNDVSKRAMDAAHQRVLDIRKDEDYGDILKTYDVESWFDASGELTSKFYEDVESASSELIPYMNQFVEIVGTCKKDWYENAEAIESNNEAMANLRVEEYIKYQERLVESLDFDATLSQSLSTAKEGMYDIFRTLRQEKAEMDKELKANMQIDDWLTEDTRRRLFNLDDYEKQMGVINKIEAEAQSLYIEYQNDLANLKEDELYKEEEITAEYNRQLEKLKDRLSIAKSDLQLAKDKAAFENALKERDTQIIMGNRVQNVADPERLREAAMKMAESENSLENEKITSAENQDIRNMQAATGMINQEKGAIQNRIDMINGMTEEERRVFADFLEPLQVYRNKILALTKTNPYRIITGDNSNDVFMSRDYRKIEGYSLTQDHSGVVDEIQHLLNNGYYKYGTAEYDVALRTIDFLKKQHDDKTTSDAHNYGYDLYDPANSVNWYRYMKMYTDLGYAIQAQETPSVNDIMSQAYEDAVNNLPVISGEGEVIVSGISLEGYKKISLAEMISPLLDDPSMAESIAQSIMPGAIAPNVDTINAIASVFSRANTIDLIKNGNNDNSIHMENVNVTLEKPVADPNDFVQQLIRKVNSEYSTTNNQR